MDIFRVACKRSGILLYLIIDPSYMNGVIVLEDFVQPAISHDLQEETPEAKARWFQSLSLAERMDMLCSFTDFVLSVNPHIVESRHAQSFTGRIQILSAIKP